MSEAHPPREPERVPDALTVSHRRRFLSLVWIVPMVAALVAGWLVVQTLLRQGPTITIAFNTAEGIDPGITRIKYRDVDVGTVAAVTLSRDRRSVIVTARMQRQAESLLNAGTRFWVVRPRISASSVSGLGTLFSGAYIGMDAGDSDEEKYHFDGLETPPVIVGNKAGTQYLLHSETLGSVDIGSPVYYRQVQVGQVVAYGLAPDGKSTVIRIFVNAPYDRFVTSSSRFWNASGVDARFDAGGFRVDTQSLVSILIGGIAFRTPPEALVEPQAAAVSEFQLYRDETAALKQPDRLVQPALMVFQESARGLAVGAPLDFRGIQIGEVTAIDVYFDRKAKRAMIAVRAEVYPNRLSSRRESGSPMIGDTPLLQALIERGLHAQLRQGNLLTGQLYVALDFGPAGQRTDIPLAPGVVQIPTAASSLTEIQTTLANVAKKLEQMPLEQLTADVRKSLAELNATLSKVGALATTAEREVAPEVRKTLAEMRQVLQSAEGTMATARAALERAQRTLEAAQGTLESDAPVQTDLRDTLREVSRAAEAVRNLAELLEREPQSLLRGKSR
jgi:paraquat-inducible protein B